MRLMFPNTAPVSAFAAAGACVVSPVSRLRVTPAVASLLAAKQLPKAHQDQARKLIMAAAGYTIPVQETPSTNLGGFRGVPPRRKPV